MLQFFNFVIFIYSIFHGIKYSVILSSEFRITDIKHSKIRIQFPNILRNPLLRNRVGRIGTRPRTKRFALGHRQNHDFGRGNRFEQGHLRKPT